MNCIAQCIDKVLGLDIYKGVGHTEPIHFSEVIAYLLSEGWATTQDPIDTPLGVHEGLTAASVPHMVPLGEPLATIEITWYFVPIDINSAYKEGYNEIIRMATGTGRVQTGSSRCDG